MFKYLRRFITGISTVLVILVTLTSAVSIEEIEVRLPDQIQSYPSIEARDKQERLFDSATNAEQLKITPTPEEEAIPVITFNKVSRSPYRELLTRNEDYRGWITVNGTDISYPIVKGEDNDYYLKRSFDRNYDLNGTVFMDYRNLGFGFSQHIILYGHNMKDGSMFGDLKKYKDEGFALENRKIEIEDFYGTRYFEIYASYYAAADSSLITTEFYDTRDYQRFIDQQLSQSNVNYNFRPDENSYILTLVTCSYEVDDGRYLVHAVEVDGP